LVAAHLGARESQDLLHRGIALGVRRVHG
jgi:hypothetical protein